MRYRTHGQWVEILNEISCVDDVMILGCCYVPPEYIYSKYVSNEGFDEIQNELLSENFNNARKMSHDYSISDEKLIDTLNMMVT